MRERVRLQWECPFCSGPIQVYETTTPPQDEAGLVYLGSKCVPCNARFDAAGIGAEDAVKDFDERMRRRRGTRPEDWRIKPREERKRGRGRRWSR